MSSANTPTTTADEDPFLKHYLPGTSPAVVELRRLVAQLNATRNTDLIRVILIRGETGAGKNYLAEVLAAHRYWQEVRDAGADFGLNVGLDAYTGGRYGEILLPALPEVLIESELFGHVKGAFTGATKDRVGLLGSGYTDILLDEIGDAPLYLQAKLLTVVDHGRYRPVGADAEADSTSARLLMATNQNLEALIENGKFRSDLYARAQEFVVTVPPLREQPENIPAIIAHLHERLTKGRSELEPPPSLSPDEVEWAQTYRWPFNVRQLRHALKRWLFEDGRNSLEEIVEQTAQQMSLSQKQNSAAAIKALVRERIEGALHRGLPCPGSLGELAKEFDEQVKAAVHEWYAETRPSKDDLMKLFPTGGLDALRSKLSQWGKKNREGTS